MNNNVKHLLGYVMTRLVTFNLGSAKFDNLSGTSTFNLKNILVKLCYYI
jgi:hypothetical protein